MQSALIEEFPDERDPWQVAKGLPASASAVLLESQQRHQRYSRYSLLTGWPFLRFRSFGSRCELRIGQTTSTLFGNPWHVLGSLMARYDLPDQLDVPFPVGGCFGFWGYGLAPFAEPAIRRVKSDERGLPDCALGFHHSLIVFDHELRRTWVVASGLEPDGKRSRAAAIRQLDHWLRVLAESPPANSDEQLSRDDRHSPGPPLDFAAGCEAFLRGVTTAQRYIRRGDVYQVNLSRRIGGPNSIPPARWYEGLRRQSPAPFAMYLDGPDCQLMSHSPELFLRMSGPQVTTRPIKGTRLRGVAPADDWAGRRELLASPKERAELLMITDLLRHDLGRICEFGSVSVPELRRLETHGSVHQAVATIEGRLRRDIGHTAALAACFPGGSITGAPKIRATEIIDELEPVARGPYTGCGGYLGFNRESQLNLLIRTAIAADGQVWFHTGAGIVADSDPEGEYAETVAKASVFHTVALSAERFAGAATVNATDGGGRTR